MNQIDVVENGNSQAYSDIPWRGPRRNHCPSCTTQYVCLTDYGRLHNDNVVHITDGRSDERIQFHKFRGLVEEIEVVENKVLGQVIERL